MHLPRFPRGKPAASRGNFAAVTNHLQVIDLDPLHITNGGAIALADPTLEVNFRPLHGG
jgi:hypothetical protein